MKIRLTTKAWILSASLFTAAATAGDALDELINFRIDNPKMVSSGQPDEQEFEALKAMGVTQVIDLVPGDRTEETQVVKELGMEYRNIQVDWESPTVQNFADYVGYMQTFNEASGITLTHCRKNWRGAVFTYLYRVTQLHESEEQARRDMLTTWEPNDTWLKFIDEVKASY